MSYKEILDNVSNIENLDNVTILKTLEKFSKAIRDFAEQQTGLQNLLNVEFEPSENAVTYSNGSVDYLGNLKITLADNIIVNKPCSIKFNIKGSETIVVDVDEFDNALEIHLDNSIITTIDFAEIERQKSKNLLVYPYKDTTNTTNGITFTDNGDGSITINGVNNGGGNSNFFFTSTTAFKLSAGTYTLGNFVSTNNNVNVVLYDGSLYHQVPSNSSKTLTYNNETTCYIYIGINRGTTETFNNVVVKPMLVSGRDLGDYQPYYGAIVHEKDIQPHIATATLISDYIHSATNTYEKLPITLYNVAGNKLTVKDNAIYVGNNVSKVKVSAMVQFNIANASDVFCAINKNENRISFVGVKPNTSNISIAIPPFVVDTGEGNYFTLWGYIANASNNVIGSSSIRTYLTVEVVE